MLLNKIKKEYVRFLHKNLLKFDDEEWYKNCIFGKEYYRKSYSQDGEDMVISSFLGNKGGGFYVDIGAFHPLKFSNTQYFYEKEWRGINIDANPGSMELFRKHRPRDINIECGIGESESEMSFYIFEEPAFNTFSEKLANSRTEWGNRILDNKLIKVLPLKSILDLYLPEGQKIDFIDIDAEDIDFEVLKSNDWEKYRPDIISVEYTGSINDLFKNDIYNYLTLLGYEFIARTRFSNIFKSQ